MKIFGININIDKQKEVRACCDNTSLNYYGNKYYGNNSALLLSAVYRCVEVLSESVAQLPIKVYNNINGKIKEAYNHPVYEILARFPSCNLTRHTFLKKLVTDMVLNGNSYAYIERDDKMNVLGIHYIPSNQVNIIYNQVDPINRNIRYQVTGMNRYVEDWEMIHIVNYTNDGINGISTLSYARQTLGISLASENQASKFFNSGANLNGIITSDTSLTSTQKSDIKQSWNNTFSADGTGIAVLEGNLHFQPITVNPVDAQLLETRKHNIGDVCRYFGVNPILCFDLDHSSYSTVEATNLAFLTQTLQPILQKFELEFERKLFRPSERKYIDVQFDTKLLVRADLNAQSNYYRTLFQLGALTPNEIRSEINMEPVEGGDRTFVQVNMSTLDNNTNNTIDLNGEGKQN